MGSPNELLSPKKLDAMAERLERDEKLQVFRAPRAAERKATIPLFPKGRWLPNQSMYQICQEVIAAYGLSLKDLRKRGRQAELVQPRHTAIYIMHELGWNYSQLARFFGEEVPMNHCTMTYACSVVKKRMELSEQYREGVQNLLDRLKTPCNANPI